MYLKNIISFAILGTVLISTPLAAYNLTVNNQTGSELKFNCCYMGTNHLTTTPETVLPGSHTITISGIRNENSEMGESQGGITISESGVGCTLTAVTEKGLPTSISISNCNGLNSTVSDHSVTITKQENN